MLSKNSNPFCCQRWVVVALIFLAFHTGFAQSKRLDSLKSSLTELTGTKRVDVLHSVAVEYWNYSLEEALKYAQQANSLARELKYERGIAFSLTDIGLYYFFTGNYELSKQFLNQSLQVGPSDELPHEITYTFLGNVFRDQSQFDSANYFYGKALELSNKRTKNIARWVYPIIYFHQAELDFSFLHLNDALEKGSLALKKFEENRDSLRMGYCWALLGSIYSWKYQFEEATKYYDKLFLLTQKNDNYLLRFLYYFRKGDLAFRMNKHAEAITYYNTALEFLKKNDYRRYHPDILMKIGRIFQLQGDFNRALEHFISALEINTELGNVVEQSKVNVLLGWLYLSEENDSLAFEYGQEALRLSQSVNYEAGIASGYNLLGNASNQLGSFVMSHDYFNKALEIRQKLDLPGEMATTLYSISEVYIREGKLANAVELLSRIIDNHNTYVDKQLLTKAYNTLGDVYVRLGKYSKASECLREGHQLAVQVNLPVERRDNYRLQAELKQRTSDYKAASQFYQKYVSLNDSLFNTEAMTKVAQLNAVYQLSNKEKEIRQLSEQNKEKESQINIQQEQIRWQRNVLFMTIIGVLFLSILVYVLYIYYKQKNRAHQILKEFHREMSEKNEEIQAQSEELIEANESLSELNNDLLASREEVQAKSEELIRANNTISEINKDLEMKVQLRTDQLRQAYVELDTFFYRSSHDFRRPLTTFLGLTEVAKITVKDVNALELFEKVEETALNLDKMLLKLQSISDVGAHQLVYKEVFLREMLMEITDNFRAEMDKRKIRCMIDYQVTSKFLSYAALVRIIIENLLENAINFSGEENSYIKIRVFEQEKKLVLVMEDNGQGISEALADRIFDMYFRANHASTGNGLGLYIVKKAVEKLNGDIIFKTELNAGSTFTVNLPLE